MMGTWMAYTLAVSAVMLVAGLGVERALERLGRPTRWVWLGGMLAGVAVPVGALLRAPLPAAPLPAGSGRVGEIALVGIGALPESTAAPLALDTALLLGWGAASLLVTLALGWSLASLARTRRGWRRETVERTRVWISEHTGPAVVGFLRPAIVLPAWVLGWDPALRRLIVAHEREHVRAGDSRLLLAGLLLLCAAPWNVALWWQWRRLRQAVETDCDRRVLAAEPDVRRYGSLLLEVAERTRRQALPMAAFAESRSFLERRIRMMTNRQIRHRAGWTAALAAAGLIAPAALLALPAPAPLGVAGVRAAVAGRAEVEAARVATVSALLQNQDTVPFAYEVAVLEKKPELTNKGEVAAMLARYYPRILKDAGVGGQVMMQFVITPGGTVDPATVKVIHASREEFGDASAEVVKTFRFVPGTYKGKPVRVLLQMPITWQPPAPPNPAEPLPLLRAAPPAPTEPPPPPPTRAAPPPPTRAAPPPPRPAGIGSVTRPGSSDSTKFSYEVAVLQRKPELLNRAEVRTLVDRVYPRELKDAGVSGNALMQFVIASDGTVDPSTIKVVSTSDPRFATPGRLVAEKLTFEPGLYKENAIRTLIQMPISWQPTTETAPGAVIPEPAPVNAPE